MGFFDQISGKNVGGWDIYAAKGLHRADGGYD
jgi:hypothetical protein